VSAITDVAALTKIIQAASLARKIRSDPANALAILAGVQIDPTQGQRDIVIAAFQAQVQIVKDEAQGL
jgi:hypothetical protein